MSARVMSVYMCVSVCVTRVVYVWCVRVWRMSMCLCVRVCQGWLGRWMVRLTDGWKGVCVGGDVSKGTKIPQERMRPHCSPSPL